jgi:HK97 family phage major capsid protein
MPKPIDAPEQLTGQDRTELAAEPAIAKLHDLVKSSVKEVLGVERAEMMEEYRKVANEAAQKVLGQREEASQGDPENIYTQKDMEGMFRRLMGEQTAEAPAENPAAQIAKGAMYLYRAGGNPHIAGQLMEKDGYTGDAAMLARKAVGVDDFSAGGALLQGDMMMDVVPELLSETAVASDDMIMKVPVNGQLSIPYESSGPTTYHVEEGAAANASEPAFDQLTLTPHQATIIVPASRKMLTSVALGAQVIERSMRRSLQVDCDAKLIRGVGGESEPTGLRYLANSSNVLTVQATVSADNTMFDMLRLQEAVTNSNVAFTMPRTRTLISPRSWRYLFGLQSSHNYLFREEMAALNTINGSPIGGQSGRGISAIPENLSVTDSSETEIYFYSVDWLLMALGEDLRMEMTSEGAYNDSSGTVQSAFSRDQVVFKLVWHYDFGSKVRGHDIAVLSDVDWGA